MRFRLDAALQCIARRLGLDVQRNSLLWQSDTRFQELLRSINGRTLVSNDRCFMLYQYALLTLPLDGALAEVGVYKGGTAKLLADACPNTPLHLFDTFCGLPATMPHVDRLLEGDFDDTTLASVVDFVGERDNITYYPGSFPETTEGIGDERFRLVHVDADLYESISSALRFFFPRLTAGGVIVVDDYEWKECPGVKKAIDEFCEEAQLFPIVTCRYQCILQKRMDMSAESTKVVRRR